MIENNHCKSLLLLPANRVIKSQPSPCHSCIVIVMSDPRPREITVLYFAAASTATNLTSERILIPEGRFFLSSLSDKLVALHPNTNPDLEKVLEGSQWSVDAEMVDDPRTLELKGGEEVAVICPVSGG